jgi:hypothetical protein
MIKTTIALASLALLVGCSKKETPAPAPAASAAVEAPSTAPAPKAAAPTIDAPNTIKEGDDVQVKFSNASSVGNSVVMVFGLNNTSGKEKNVSSVLSYQATTPEGVPGNLDILKSKCDGTVPPNGKFMCALKFDFSEAPTELNVKAEGAWFTIRPEVKK